MGKIPNYFFMTRKKLEKSGILALQMLRKESLDEGHPFMINSENLPVNQCYMEYPDGRIHLVAISRAKSDFELIKEFTGQEAVILKKQLQLSF
jgi:hypothetical protein